MARECIVLGRVRHTHLRKRNHEASSLTGLGLDGEFASQRSYAFFNDQRSAANFFEFGLRQFPAEGKAASIVFNRQNPAAALGRISAAQATQLHREDQNIRSQEKFYAMADHGRITRTQSRLLNQEENAIRRQLYQEQIPTFALGYGMYVGK